MRRLWASTALEGYLDGPGARQVLKIEREIQQQGRRHREVRTR